MDPVVVVLLAFILLREVWNSYERNKLVNKLMSRNYHEYTVAKNLGKLDQSGKDPDAEVEVPVEIGQLMGIG